MAWSTTIAGTKADLPSCWSDNDLFRTLKDIVLENDDVCKISSWVIFAIPHPAYAQTDVKCLTVGQVVEILRHHTHASTSATQADAVLIQVATINRSSDRYNMPLIQNLALGSGPATHKLVVPQVRSFF
jgi:hypothetical protein